MLRKRLLSYGLSLAVLGTVGAACSTKAIRDDFGSDAVDAGNGEGTGPGIDNGEGGIGGNNDTFIEVKGTTFAPNEELELSGVVVYWSSTEPSAIPDGTYCDKCLELVQGTFATSAADGTFTLRVPTGREIFIVTQKGQFQRVRKVTFEEDDTKIDEEFTTLPSKTRASAGDFAPKIGIVNGTYDKIADVFEELGVESVDSVAKSDLGNLDKLKDYHFLMFPCDSVGGANSCGNPKAQEPEVQEALREYAKAGGKIYASDWSYEYVNQAFPGFIQFKGPGPGEGCTSSYTSTGRYEDPDMAAWMEAIGEDDIEFHGNYTEMTGVSTQDGPDATGATVPLTPKVWATSVEKIGGASDPNFNRPATVSIPYGCGRALFSTFHTEADEAATAQKKALLYVLLEVSACIPPGGDIN